MLAMQHTLFQTDDYRVQVAIPRPLGSALTYRWLASDPPQIGLRVRVPLGSRELVGLVIGTEIGSAPHEFKQLKAVLEVLDQQPVLDAPLLSLGRFISQYYHQPIGEVLFALLPNLLRHGQAATASQERYWGICDQADLSTPLRGQRQKALLHRLQEHDQQRLTVSELRLMGFNRSHFQGLAQKQLVQELLLSHQPQRHTQPLDAPLALTGEQAQVLSSLELHRFACHLIFGVTGSGKTEIYLQSIERCLQAGKQALLLVPEIGLTPQLLQRFQRRFNSPIALLHSGLNDQERLNQWLWLRNGEARICIGTRSALFIDAPDLGLIIVDEEHDPSFKQQDGIRYQARDMAVKRAAELRIPILLGSATPSLESLHNAYQGRYQLHYLQQRANDAQPPFLEMVDMRQQPKQQGLAANTSQRIEQHLAQGNQILIFLNRRGYAPGLLCGDCGWLADCPNCDARLVLHPQPERLQCHHCGWQHPLPQHCPSCGSGELQAIGMGTVRLEEQLQQQWPNTPLVRIDRDSTQSQHLAEQLAKIPSDQAGIFLGTQMLAKGHHLPSITLVVIVDGDAGFQGPDFRNLERMAQQFVQVAGRAGRGDRLGEVLIQSRFPDHPFFQQLIAKGYETLAQQWLQQRAALSLPPYAAMATLRADHQRAEHAYQQLVLAKERLLSQGFAGRLLGPVPAPMSKRQGLHRFLLYLYCPQRAQLQSQLHQLQQWQYQQRLTSRLGVALDVDPYDLG